MQYVQGSHNRLPLFFRRLVVCILIVVTLISSTVLPRASAIAPAIVVPAAVVSFVGVVAIGAIAMDVFGYTQQSDETMAFAQSLWDVSTQAMKDSVMESYNAALAAGSKTMTLSQSFVDWVADGYAGLGVAASASTLTYGSSTTLSYTTNKPYFTGLTIKAPAGYYFAKLLPASSVTNPKNLPVGYWSSISAVIMAAPYYTAIDYTGVLGGLTIKGNATSYGYAEPDQFFVATPTRDEIGIVSRTVFGSLPLVPVSVPQQMLDNKQAIRDAFPASVPVPMPNDFVYTPTANPGIDVQQKGDQLVDDAGKVYAPDQVQVKAVPKTRVVTDAAGVPLTDAAGKPIVAVPVGQIGVGASAIPATLVNVRTGEAVKTETGTANPPFDTSIGKINWAPITGLPAAFTNTFPFSLPWDVKRLIDLMVAAPVVPRIEADFYGQRMVITLPRMVTDNILLIRSGIIIAVLLGLVFATRRLLGGAQ